MEFITLSGKDIIEAVKSKRAGTMFRIKYKSELPVKAAFKKKGIKIIKVTESTVRCGVDYDNITSVIEKKSAEEYREQISRQNNYSWVIEDRILHNSNTNRDYIRVATIPNHSNTRCYYITVSEDGDEITDDTFDTDYVIPSYFNKGEQPPVKNIGFDNIISIN